MKNVDLSNTTVGVDYQGGGTGEPWTIMGSSGLPRWGAGEPWTILGAVDYHGGARWGTGEPWEQWTTMVGQGGGLGSPGLS